MAAFLIAFGALALVAAIHIHMRDMEYEERAEQAPPLRETKSGRMRASGPTRNGGSANDV